MQITQEQLQQLHWQNPTFRSGWTEALNKILPDYGIDTPQRVAAFIGTVRP
jgi:predicted chitinase